MSTQTAQQKNDLMIYINFSTEIISSIIQVREMIKKRHTKLFIIISNSHLVS